MPIPVMLEALDNLLIHGFHNRHSQLHGGLEIIIGSDPVMGVDVPHRHTHHDYRDAVQGGAPVF